MSSADDTTADAPRHPIGIVSRRTGLKADLVRAWERRYKAVQPRRGKSDRRLYSDADIKRLKLLRQAVAVGRAIRFVAPLDNEELERVIAADTADAAAATLDPGTGLPLARPALSDAAVEEEVTTLSAVCLNAVRELDTSALEAALERACVTLSRFDVLDRLLVPLLHEVGDRWRQGHLRPSHEHLASSVIRTFLGRLPAKPVDPAPCMLVTTPAGQLHELGALVAAECAAGEGWQVTFLGPNLPAEEIAAGGHQKRVRAVALSITYPRDDSRMGSQLRHLRHLLAPATEIIVGGRAAEAYAPILKEINARYMPTLKVFRTKLDDLRGAA